MRKLVYLTAARDDLIEIQRHIARESASVDVARQFVARLQEHCRRLANLPGTLGTARPDLRVNLRSTPSQGYVIFFRYTGNTVEIVNVLHGSRDVQVHYDTH